MAKRILAAALLLASLALAAGFAVPTANLNKLIVQRTITDLGAQKLELNPYGLELITKSSGLLVKGNFLATQWNDADNNPGQGHSILQVTPAGKVSVFATIDARNSVIQKRCGNVGVGLTMALTILKKGLVIVGSTPVPVGGQIAGPGCLIALDSSGNFLDAHSADEPTTTPGIRTGGGPWAFAVQDFGSTVNLYVSYVLGGNPNSNTQLTGTQGGKVVRYGLQIPSNTVGPTFWGTAPDIIAWGFPTVPAQITMGVVGPTGLLLVKDPKHNDRLFIANNLNSSVVGTPNPGNCFSRPGGTPQCVANPHAWGGLINGPIGLSLAPNGNIVGANGNVGTLFEFQPATFGNRQMADQLVDNAPPAVGAGTLFNVRFLAPNTILFNDDGMNTFNTLTMS